jgi:hypothetical protein
MDDLKKIEIMYVEREVVCKMTMRAGHWVVFETYDLEDGMGGFFMDPRQRADVFKSLEDAVQCAFKRALILGWRWGFREPWMYGTSEVDYSRCGKFRDFTGKFPSEAAEWIKDCVGERWRRKKK